MTLAHLTDVHLRLGGRPVLRGLSLEVRRGEVHALLGGNGAGKSTTLQLLLGFLAPDSGSVRVTGLDPRREPAARARLAYVPENAALYGQLTARENLSYLLSLAGADPRPGAVEDALRRAGLPAGAWDRRLSTFSKGMAQKVAIALALARDVPLLLLDEPTSGLDPGATAEFNALLGTLRDAGVGILMVTHDLAGAAAVADRVGLLRDGRLAEEFRAGPGPRFDLNRLHAGFAAPARPGEAA